MMRGAVGRVCPPVRLFVLQPSRHDQPSELPGFLPFYAAQPPIGGESGRAQSGAGRRAGIAVARRAASPAAGFRGRGFGGECRGLVALPAAARHAGLPQGRGRLAGAPLWPGGRGRGARRPARPRDGHPAVARQPRGAVFRRPGGAFRSPRQGQIQGIAAEPLLSRLHGRGAGRRRRAGPDAGHGGDRPFARPGGLRGGRARRGGAVLFLHPGQPARGGGGPGASRPADRAGPQARFRPGVRRVLFRDLHRRPAGRGAAGGRAKGWATAWTMSWPSIRFPSAPARRVCAAVSWPAIRG